MKTFVLLHGAWYNSWWWQPIKEKLETIGHRVITIDFPNYKNKNQRKDRKEITLNSYVATVEKVVQEHVLPKEKIILVGHSMSGIVASSYAEKYHDQIDKLIYVSAFLLKNDQSIKDIVDRRRGDIGAPKLRKSPYERDVVRLRRTATKDRLFHDVSEDARSPEIRDLIKQLDQWTPAKPLSTKIRVTKQRFGSVDKHYIVCTKDRAILPSEQLKMYSEVKIAYGNIKKYEILSSHSPFQSKPDELTKCFLDIISVDRRPNGVFNDFSNSLNSLLRNLKNGLVTTYY